MTVNQVMPFGRFKGCKLIELPEPYLVWFHNLRISGRKPRSAYGGYVRDQSQRVGVDARTAHQVALNSPCLICGNNLSICRDNSDDLTARRVFQQEINLPARTNFHVANPGEVIDQ